ncbi:MAG: DegT/DnrJ/EryC1/StrS family aminotransferase [Kiritimatiellia bacterium]
MTAGRIFLSPPHMGGTELDHVQAAFASNYIAPVGPQLTAFERRFSEVTGFPHVVAVASGTAAMHLALRHLGIGPGDVVLASSLTFIGSVSPITMQGATPVFIDSDEATWNIDTGLLEEEIAHWLGRGVVPKAIIPTDLYGQPCDYDRILALARPHGIPVLADTAESLGATYRGRSTGLDARAAVVSFNGNKILTTSGGGMLASQDPELIAHARHLATQTREPFAHFEHREIGYNYRMSNVVAAIGLGQLDVLAERVAKRRLIFQWYSELLGDLPGLSFMPEPTGTRATRWLTVLRMDPRRVRATPEDIRLHLEAHDIESRPVWKPMHLQPAYAGARVRGGDVSASLFQQGLCLPSGTAMDRDTVGRIAGLVREAWST